MIMLSMIHMMHKCALFLYGDLLLATKLIY